MAESDDALEETAAVLAALTETVSTGDDRPLPDLPERTGSGRTTIEQLSSVTAALGRSARGAGAGAVSSGRWVAETTVDLAGRLPVRDLEVASAAHAGLRGDALADAMIRRTSRASASVGAAAGAIMAAEEMLPPAWLMMPIEIVVETVVVAGLEMKLIGELQEVYGHPVAPPGTARAYALARAWAARRGVNPTLLASGTPAMAGVLGLEARVHVIRLVRNRLVRRAGANISGLVPFMVGAAAGAAINGRATRQLGEVVQADLRS